MAIRKRKLGKADKIGVTVALCMGVLLAATRLWQNHLNIDPTPDLTARQGPRLNAFDFDIKAGQALATGNELLSAIAHPPSPKKSARVYTLAEKEALLKRNARALQMLRQGFQYPYRHAPAHSTDDASFYAPFSPLRRLAYLLVLEGQVKAARGDHGGAANSYLDAIRLGADAARGSALIGMLVGHVCERAGRHALRGANHHLNAAQAKQAARRLEAITARHVSYADTMKDEKRFGQMAMMELLRQPDWRRTWPKHEDWEDEEDEEPVGAMTRARLWLYSDRAIMSNYSGYLDALIAQAQQPYAARSPLPVPADPVNAKAVSEASFGGQSWVNELNNRTHNALLLTSLALRAHKLEHGSYPQTLQALAPAYIKRVPGDPFAVAGPLRFKRINDGRAGSGYLLYSVGPDGKDDSGRPITGRLFAGQTPNGENNVGVESKGDVVMQPGVPAKAGGR